jgi:hypothetical protein
MKKNITITADEETARWVRIEAARHEKSVSRFVGDLLRERREREDEYERAMKWYLSREPVRLRSDPSTHYPSREELHDRASLR